MSGELRVEVAWAEPDQQALVSVELPAGSTVRDAIEASGLEARFPAMQIDDQHVGIFSRRCRLDDTVATGDRVEIYRDLTADPKETRRALAALGQATD